MVVAENKTTSSVIFMSKIPCNAEFSLSSNIKNVHFHCKVALLVLAYNPFFTEEVVK